MWVTCECVVCLPFPILVISVYPPSAPFTASPLHPTAPPPSGARLVFRFEPFILHAECRNLEVARDLQTVARAVGYRESGITIGSSGRGDRIMVRV